MPHDSLKQLTDQRRALGMFDRQRAAAERVPSRRRGPPRRDDIVARGDVVRAVLYSVLLCTAGPARRFPGLAGRIAPTATALPAIDASASGSVAAQEARTGGAVNVGVASSPRRTDSDRAVVLEQRNFATARAASESRRARAARAATAPAPAPAASRDAVSSGATEVTSPAACLGATPDALREQIGILGDRDRDLLAELRGGHCDVFGADWADCTHDMLRFGEFCEEARSLSREQAVARVAASPALRRVAHPFLSRLQELAGLVPAWPTEQNALHDALADQLVMHSWGRYIRHAFLTSPEASARYIDPVNAFDAVAKWARCQPAACGPVAEPRQGHDANVAFVTVLLLALARNDTLYGPVVSIASAPTVRPALVSLDAARTVFPSHLSYMLWYARRQTALVVNPQPEVPGSGTIRFDGVSFRGATGRSQKRDAALLDAAQPYGCARPTDLAEPVDRTAPIGTVKHSLRSVLNLLSVNATQPPPGGNEAVHLAYRLTDAIADWKAAQIPATVHPGWLAALHLAYSNGFEPLSMAQLRALWQKELYPRYAAELDRFVRVSNDQSSWLRSRLSLLPPITETPVDAELISWIYFLRDDLSAQIEQSDAAGTDAETQRLRRWQLPWRPDRLLFYRTPAEHFHLVGAYFIERMQALLVEAHLWKVPAAARAVERGDVKAFNELTAWLGQIGSGGEGPTALPLAQIGLEGKTTGLHTAMQRFRDGLLAHPAMQANAAEALREEQSPTTPVSVRARAISLIAQALEPEVPTTQHAFTVGTLLGMLPIFGAAMDLVHDVEQGRYISAVIDGVELYLQAADLYGAAVETLFPEEVTGCFESGSAQLAEDDMRTLHLPEEGRSVRAVRRGAVYQEWATATGKMVDAGAIIAYDSVTQRFRRVLLREIRDATRLPAAHRFTVRAAERLITGLVKSTDLQTGFRAAFDRRFTFAEGSPQALVDVAMEAYAFFDRHSPTFRRLFASSDADGKQWTIHIGENKRFRTVFGDQHNLGENRIELGINTDAQAIVYMGVDGPAYMTYWRAVLHELVHALTGLPDTAFDAYYERQKIAVRRIQTHLETLTPPSPTFSMLFSVRLRRRRALRRTLKAANSIVDGAHLGMAEQRGPIVYFVDRILQECKTGWPERVMYLASPIGDTARQAVMNEQRVGAATRMHEENDRLDRAWLKDIEVTPELQFGRDELVRDRAVVREWQAFVEKLAELGPAPAGNWLDMYLLTPTYVLRAEVQRKVRVLLEDASVSSPTFAALLQAWRAGATGTHFWTFAMLGNDRRLLDAQSRYIDLSDNRYILTALGPEAVSLPRRVISGTVALLLHDIGFAMPDSELEGRRSLGVLVEKRILKELSFDELLRVNAATYTPDELTPPVIGSISVLRRAALLEDRYIEGMPPSGGRNERPTGVPAAR